jgi:hypothetical protein
MGFVQRIVFVVLISGLMAAQSSVPSAGDEASQRDGDLKKLLDAVAAQEKETNAQKNAIAEQQRQIADQQRQLAEQRAEIESLKQQLGAHRPATAAGQDSEPARMVQATLHEGGASPASAPSVDTLVQEPPKSSTLSIRIGDVELTPGGSIDLTAFWRSTNVGSGFGTNFFSIPFANTIPGQITETRLTAENSRLNLKATDTIKGNHIIGYFEADFHGNDPANLNVTSNSSTLRLRQAWSDIRRGNWELLAGQAWSWLAPNRVGMGSLTQFPSNDVFFTLNMDANYQVGLTWTRSPQVRGAYHPNEHWGLGVGLENPDQFVGQTGQVTFPAAFNTAAVTSQFDAANQTTTPNLHPDVLAKIAYDTDSHGKHFHVEGVGLLTTIRVLPVLGGSTNSKTGGGISGAFNLEVLKGFRLIGNAFWSDGGGRYLFGSGPDAVLKPNGTLSLVHAGAGLGGFEWQATKEHQFGVYYGANYFQRNFFLDTSAGAKPLTFVGYGGPGATTNAANRAIQEATGDWVISLWRDPQYGALQLVNQVSYLTRAPWVVPLGQPKNARSTMVWVNVRYIIP